MSLRNRDELWSPEREIGFRPPPLTLRERKVLEAKAKIEAETIEMDFKIDHCVEILLDKLLSR